MSRFLGDMKPVPGSTYRVLDTTTVRAPFRSRTLEVISVTANMVEAHVAGVGITTDDVYTVPLSWFERGSTSLQLIQHPGEDKIFLTSVWAWDMIFDVNSFTEETGTDALTYNQLWEVYGNQPG